MEKTLQPTGELSLADELSPFWTHVLSSTAILVTFQGKRPLNGQMNDKNMLTHLGPEGREI